MNDDADATPVVVQEPGTDEVLALPSDPRVILQAGIFVILLLAAMYITASITLPLVLALLLKMLLSPLMRMLEGLKLPSSVAALLLIIAVFVVVVMLASALAAPARLWADKLPEGLPRLQERLSFMSTPVQTVRHFLQRAEDLGREATATPVTVQGNWLSAALFAGTASFASGLFTMILLLYFMLISGDLFLRRLVEILPRFRDKRQAVEISKQIETNVSAYLVTITVMNLAVGVATAVAMWLCGLDNPLLWGTLALLLNYVPIVGPLICLAILVLVGLLTSDTLGHAFLPAGVYLLIHMIEGQTVTPLLVAKRFTLNPVAVMLSLVFWHWMWGVPGAILAVPMLAMFKIICDGVGSWAAFGHLIEGQSSD